MLSPYLSDHTWIVTLSDEHIGRVRADMTQSRECQGLYSTIDGSQDQALEVDQDTDGKLEGRRVHNVYEKSMYIRRQNCQDH